MRVRILMAALAAGAVFCLTAIAAEPDTKMVERGKFIAMIGGCDDCHSPKVFTDKGPAVDDSKALSGHPAGMKLPEIPTDALGPDKWGAVTTNDLTAWAGPWGVSFAANLTPDVKTGLGSWNDAMFIKAMRTGQHLGAGRPILPPMPWQAIGKLSDEDLKALFSYLKSLKPVENAVPDPLPPPALPAH